MASIRNNIFWNVLRVTSNLLFPLITFPYASRILGPESIGLFNFAIAIASYFTLFASLGFPLYGTREIAVQRDDQEKFNKTVNSIFSANILATVIVQFVYIIVILLFESTNILLFLILGLTIFLNTFSFEWFYQGIENFKYLTIRGIIIKSISVICLYLFVKGPQDLIIYAILSVVATCGNNLLNLLRLRRYIKLRFTTSGIWYHTKGASALFFSSIAISFYTYLNDIMVGALDNMESVAFFSTGNRIIHIILSIIGVITISIMPRMSKLIGNGDKFQSLELQKKTISLTLYIVIPIAIGVIILSRSIIILFAGDKFIPTTMIMPILASLIIIMPLSSFFGNQILIPNRKEKLGNYAVGLGAVVNILLAIILIPNLSFVGVAISLVFAEFTVTTLAMYFARRYTELSLKDFIPYKCIISALVMGIIVYALNQFESRPYFAPIWAIAGTVIYAALLVLMRDKFFKTVLLSRYIKR